MTLRMRLSCMKVSPLNHNHPMKSHQYISNLHQTIDFPSTTTSSSRSISALDAEGFFDEEPDTHTEIDPAKVKVTNPIEIYKMCKAKKDCPGAWLYSNGRCVHPEIEEMRRRGGFRDHPLFERARRLFY